MFFDLFFFVVLKKEARESKGGLSPIGKSPPG